LLGAVRPGTSCWWGLSLPFGACSGVQIPGHVALVGRLTPGGARGCSGLACGRSCRAGSRLDAFPECQSSLLRGELLPWSLVGWLVELLAPGVGEPAGLVPVVEDPDVEAGYGERQHHRGLDQPVDAGEAAS